MTTPVCPPQQQHSVDKRRTCSICLEAFRGRQPKILSCFHTFCSPCLIQLVEREDRQRSQVVSGTSGAEGTGLMDRPVTLTCPTCRTCVSLPEGGITQLQTNFYLDEDLEEPVAAPCPPPCDLCEAGLAAEFQCASCVHCFCSQCRRSHDKLCRSPAALLLADPQGQAGASSVGKGSRPLVDRMEDVLNKVAEREKKLALERRDLERRIHQRHSTLLHRVTQARDTSLRSLRDVTERLGDSLINTASLARKTLNRAKDQMCEQDDVVTESTRIVFDELLEKADDEPLMTYTTTDSNTQSLQQTLQQSLGSVVAVKLSEHGDGIEAGVADEDQLSRNCQAVATSCQHHAGLTENTDCITAELSSQHHAGLAENTDCSTAELSRQLQQLTVGFQQSRALTAGLQQTHNAKMADDFIALQKEMTSLKDEVTSLRGDLDPGKDKTCVLSQDSDSVRSELTSLKTSCGQIQPLASDVQTLKIEIKRLEDLYKKEETTIATLETKLNKVNKPVAFHAALTSSVTCTQRQTIVCGKVITNLGGGYNTQTGVFTAPASGLYCFMASSTTGCDDNSKRAALDIMVGEKVLGVLSAWGRGRATGHCVDHVHAGQTVSLRSWHHGTREERKFSGGWLTFFTGMLLQPDL